MSSALAVAGVTALLRELLSAGLGEQGLSGVLGRSVGVSVLAPDRVAAAGGAEASQLNLFLYLVTANPGWRAEGLPARDASGRLRLSHAPLALDLHYLLSAYSAGELHAEVLLGCALQVLHERPVLDRSFIRRVLDRAAGGSALQRALADAGLAEQVELVKLVPRTLDIEEMSKLWTAMQSHYRPSAAYTASVVLIEAAQAARAPLPVLRRGGAAEGDPARDHGVMVAAGMVPALPTLGAVRPPGRQPAARLGDTVMLQGHHLDGSQRQVRLLNDRFGIDLRLEALPPEADEAGTALRFALDPARPEVAALPVGVYGVSALLRVPGVLPAQTIERESNRIALTLAPRLSSAFPVQAPRDADGTARVSLDFEPPLHPGQRAALVLGRDEYPPAQGVEPPPGRGVFDVPQAVPGAYLVRLRIDGIDSPVIDFPADGSTRPAYVDQRVEILP